MEEAEEIRHTKNWMEIYPQRKETIERVFAEDKENHCLRYTRVRGLKKNRHVGSIIFTCHNLERLARWKWKYTADTGSGSAHSTGFQQRSRILFA